MSLDLPILISVVAGSALASFLVVAVLWHMPRRAECPEKAEDNQSPYEFSVLLRDGLLVDASLGAQRILGDRLGHDNAWRDLVMALSNRFNGVPADMPLEPAEFDAAEEDDQARLFVFTEGGLTRVWIDDRPAGTADIHLIYTMGKALSNSQQILGKSPGPIWLTSASGQVLWTNPAYRALLPDYGHGSATPIFDVDLPDEGEDSVMGRVRLTGAGDAQDRWYEVTTQRLGENFLFSATNINKVVEAEFARRNFVQTLTKTFAHLPIGLVIFDRKRQLALFNPALIDLTALPAEFLASRPNIMTFFDQLREARMMPEPKNYASWREQINDLVEATCDDRFSETWTLPSGLTYKITGRPHPDGAIAFLIEDISAEISLTRRFRAELAQSQAVLDAMEDAVAVFSQLGVITTCNKAYRAMWGTDPDASFSDISILDEVARWRENAAPNPMWSDVAQQVLGQAGRDPMSAQADHSRDGRLNCAVIPLVGGATMVRFSQIGPKLSLHDGPPREAIAQLS